MRPVYALTDAPDGGTALISLEPVVWAPLGQIGAPVFAFGRQTNPLRQRKFSDTEQLQTRSPFSFNGVSPVAEKMTVTVQSPSVRPRQGPSDAGGDRQCTCSISLPLRLQPKHTDTHTESFGRQTSPLRQLKVSDTAWRIQRRRQRRIRGGGEGDRAFVPECDKSILAESLTVRVPGGVRRG